MTEKAKKIVETLKYCASGASVDHCKECTHVFNDRKGPNCLNRLFGETVALIESLSAQLDQVTRERDALQMELDELKEEYYTGIHTARDPMLDKVKQLERERDAAVEDAHGVCKACIHYNGHYPPGEIMSCCKFEECVHGSDDWDSEDHWQWRGVEKEVEG